MLSRNVVQHDPDIEDGSAALDPRSGLLASAALVILLLTAATPPAIAAGLAGAVTVAWCQRIKPGLARPLIASGLVLGAWSAAINGLARTGQGAPIEIGPLMLWSEGLALGAVNGARLFGLMLTGLAAFQMPPGRLTQALESLGVPSRYSVLAGLGLRFLPVMRDELGRMFEARALRGMELGGNLRKAMAVGPILLPFCLRALHRANATALALELRGYGHSARRGCLRPLVWRHRDTIAVTVAGVGLFAYVVVTLLVGMS